MNGGISLGCSSMCQRLLDEIIQYAKETGAIKKPDIRMKLADLAIDIRSERIMSLESAWKTSKGETVVYEPSRDKAYNDEILEKIGQVGTEILGAYSQIDPLDRGYQI